MRWVSRSAQKKSSPASWKTSIRKSFPSAVSLCRTSARSRREIVCVELPVEEEE